MIDNSSFLTAGLTIVNFIDDNNLQLINLLTKKLFSRSNRKYFLFQSNISITNYILSNEKYIYFLISFAK